jgi:hypothetical protein
MTMNMTIDAICADLAKTHASLPDGVIGENAIGAYFVGTELLSVIYDNGKRDRADGLYVAGRVLAFAEVRDKYAKHVREVLTRFVIIDSQLDAPDSYYVGKLGGFMYEKLRGLGAFDKSNDEYHMLGRKTYHLFMTLSEQRAYLENMWERYVVIARAHKRRTAGEHTDKTLQVM